MNAQVAPNATGLLSLDIPAEQYHKRELGVASNSVLKMLREKSPAHYRAWIDAEDEDETPALAFGRAYHARVLEPETFAQRFLVAPDFGDLRSSKNRAVRDEWRAAHPGAQVITRDDADKIEAMHAALMLHPVAAGIMRDGHAEVTMRWRDSVTGVECKARADWWVPGKFFMDLKTTNDASPAGFKRSIVDYGYHVQHAHYCDGAQACGETIRNYLILAQEKEAPYVPAVYHIDAAAEIRGFELRERGLRTMADCLATDTWPGYGSGITELSLPAWALEDKK